jgi:UDP-N-acetylglucosamine 2-epimerase (non-hydrolysing)
MTKKIVHVVGARPNFMKIAPLMEALRGRPGVTQYLVNTGQHYDRNMAGDFFEELQLPVPDRDLGVGSASHAVQTARVMIGFEQVCLDERPDLVVVVGDVNSTMAAALVAAKLVIPVAHVEAGLRSFDRSMPEEINRIVTDHLSDLLLTPSDDGDANLLKEGIDPAKVHRVGNIMIDTLMKHLPAAGPERLQSRFGLAPRSYAVLTLHRPSNVDDPAVLEGIMRAVRTIAADLPVVFPVHPRTRARFQNADGTTAPNLRLTDPLGYVDFLTLTAHASIVLTDSGGLQEETTALGIPCLTLRHNTERPVTVSQGTNRIVGSDPDRILEGYAAARQGSTAERRPPLWDGHTADRVADVFARFLAP